MSEDIDHLDFEPEHRFTDFTIDPPVHFGAGDWGTITIHGFYDDFAIAPGSLAIKVEVKVNEINAVLSRFRRGAW